MEVPSLPYRHFYDNPGHYGIFAQPDSPIHHILGV